MPHVLMEKGDMTLGEFDQHLKGRTDFIKGVKKDSSAERKVRVTEATSGVAELGWHRGLGLCWTNEEPEPGVGGGCDLPEVTQQAGGRGKVDVQMQQSPWHCPPASCQVTCS